jgi:CBS domain-containing protein
MSRPIWSKQYASDKPSPEQTGDSMRGRAPISVIANKANSDRLGGVYVQDLMTPSPITIEPQESIQLAASLMVENRISCLPIVKDHQLVGLVTEADFVDRVVARGADAEQPVGAVMTCEMKTVSPAQSMLDVLTLMTRHGISHMPVCDNNHHLCGVITQTDIIRHQVATSVFMVGDISRAGSSQAIAQVVSQLPRLLTTLVYSGNTAYETGRVISSITGAATRRLLELAEQRYGPAPIPYVWLACGSQGRQEQTGVTDQDNCLILDDQYRTDLHAEYFRKLAQFVCDGLNESGYVYCPGDMMDSNSQWRQPVSVWRDYFDQWISRPGPTAQMLASVMFDLRPIHGDVALYEPLRSTVLSNACQNSIFIAHMTGNCLTHRPSLGWFGRLRTESRGERRGTIDLKHAGVVPIVDIARLYALSVQSPAVNTIERLTTDLDSPVLSLKGAKKLLDAYETISRVRLLHQVQQISRSENPSNFVDPAHLSTAERDRLRRAMINIKDIQSTMANRVSAVPR